MRQLPIPYWFVILTALLIFTVNAFSLEREPANIDVVLEQSRDDIKSLMAKDETAKRIILQGTADFNKLIEQALERIDKENK